MSTPILYAYITCKDAADARRIGRTLVLERLCACVNILPAIESFYWWNGRIEHDDEAVLLAKLPESGRDALLGRVLELHPYDTPCVVFLPVAGGNPEYLEWLAGEADDT